MLWIKCLLACACSHIVPCNLVSYLVHAGTLSLVWCLALSLGMGGVWAELVAALAWWSVARPQLLHARTMARRRCSDLAWQGLH